MKITNNIKLSEHCNDRGDANTCMSMKAEGLLGGKKKYSSFVRQCLR